MYAFFNVKLKRFFKVALLSLIVLIIFTVALLTTIKIVEKKSYPLKYKELVLESAREYNLDCALIFSVIKVESNFNNKAKSSAGALGLMQVLPSTAEYIAEMLKISEYSLFDERTNIEFGSYYLRYLIDKFSDIDTALCAYNAGEGKVKEWLKNKEYSKDGKRLFSVPYRETREYLNKIKKSLEKYKKIYENILDKL